MIKRNETEMEELNKEYKEISNKLLSESGPEGAYEISKLLIELADKDIYNAYREK